MTKLILCLLAFSSFCIPSAGQDCDPLYALNSGRADSLYTARNFAASAEAREEAIRHCMVCQNPADHYKAACAHALAGKSEMAFEHLYAAAAMGFTRLEQFMQEPDLRTLESDKRWSELLGLISENQSREQGVYNAALAEELRKIREMDQEVRRNDAEEEGRDPEAANRSFQRMKMVDSLNTQRVIEIIETYGWPGADMVGAGGNQAVWLVIQHSEPDVMEKYLPLMRDAVRRGKAELSELALLEDRVLINQGKHQIYGSQIGVLDNGMLYLRPVDNPDELDKRRACMGLDPIADYLNYFGLTWDLESYKTSMPELEKLEMNRRR